MYLQNLHIILRFKDIFENLEYMQCCCLPIVYSIMRIFLIWKIKVFLNFLNYWSLLLSAWYDAQITKVIIIIENIMLLMIAIILYY